MTVRSGNGVGSIERSERELPDLDPEINLAVGVGDCRYRRRLSFWRGDSLNSVAFYSDSDLLALQLPGFHSNLGVHLDRQRDAARPPEIGPEGLDGVGVEVLGSRGDDDALEYGLVLGAAGERREGGVPDGDTAAGEEGDGEGVVEEGEVVGVGILRGDGEVEGSGETGGGGGGVGSEVEGAGPEREDGEGRPVGVVEDVEGRSGDGGEEGEHQEEEDRPEAAAAEGAPAPPTVAPAVRGRLRAVGPVELGLRRSSRRRREAVGSRRGAIRHHSRPTVCDGGGRCRWLPRWIDPVSHIHPLGQPTELLG
ncbi:hypothetical protein SAY87_009667 [Trapa incisa]|uniref:Uncharacterized protein n=1 Tax=Trapa incisa TaxID=236973 RepID=A0AAN7JVF0_9MYRT|nr:hypothetical protein SAY87_009667 [Trapa incisa]